MAVYYAIPEENYAGDLCHYGVPRMQWGIRRYQNKDGTLTELGKRRYRKYNPDSDAEVSRLKIEEDLNRLNKQREISKALQKHAEKKKEQYDRHSAKVLERKKGDIASYTYRMANYASVTADEFLKMEKEFEKQLDGMIENVVAKAHNQGMDVVNSKDLVTSYVPTRVNRIVESIKKLPVSTGPIETYRVGQRGSFKSQ